MTTELSIKLGGLFNIAFIVFHAFFWRIFDWKRDLRNLSSLNRQVMQVLNLCLMFAFLIFAHVSLLHTAEMTGTALGRSLLLLIALFWSLRAVWQIVFFRLDRPLSMAFLAVLVLGAGLYAYPWLLARNGL